MDCSRTSVRQGAAEVTLVYRRDMKDMPAANEVHEAIEEGVTAIFQAGPTGSSPTKRRQRDRRRVHPDAARRARRVRPAPPEPAPGTEFTIPCDRVLLAIGQGPELDWIERPATRASRRRSTSASRPTRSRSRPAGRACSAPATCGSARRPSSRPSPRAAARPTPSTPTSRAMDLDAIRTRQTLAEPQPEFLSIVPFTGEVKEPRYRMTALEPRSATAATSSTSCRTRREEAVAESTRCLQCTCEAIGFCDLRRLGIEYGTTLKTLEPQYHQGAGYRSSPRTGSPASTTTTSATTPTRSSCASRRAASTAAAAPTSAPRSSAPPATTSCGSASTRSSRRRST